MDRHEIVLRLLAESYGRGENERDLLRMALGSDGFRELELMVAEDKATDARIEEWIMA